MGKGYALKEIPEDLRWFIIDEQNKIKKQTGNNRYPLELVVYKLLQELKDIREGKK